MSSKDVDKPSSETPGVWPPAPQGTPPAAATPASPMPRRRTLTPYAWLDGLLGLPGGAALAFALWQAVLTWWPSPRADLRVVIGTVALLCAAPCLLVRRRFPVHAAFMAMGMAALICIFGFLGRIFLLP